MYSLVLYVRAYEHAEGMMHLMMHGVQFSSLTLSKNQFQIAPMTCLYAGRKQKMKNVYRIVIFATF